jgi:predicted RNase H-like nuclease
VDACEAQRKTDGRGISQQTWAIVPKIREIDALLRANPTLQTWVREVHPEVSFTVWRDRMPMSHSKGTADGLAARRALVESTYGSIGPLLVGLPRASVHENDLVDAFAALWTAERIARGKAGTLPDMPCKDRFGLRMEIVF